MYRVLIVDDEQPTRRAIMALGDWERNRVSELAEATDGMGGLEKIRSFHPHIIFVDMKMPLLNGTELLRLAKSIYSDMKFVVISGFNEFSFAKAALQAGALDYLSKPIKKSEINQILSRAVTQLDQESEEIRMKREQSILNNISVPIIKEKIFSSLIDRQGKFHRISEFKSLFASGMHSCFNVSIIKLLNMEEVVKVRFYDDSHSFHIALANALNELLNPLGNAFSFPNGSDQQEYVVVLSSDARVESEIAERMDSALRHLHQGFNMECVAAIGSQVDRLDRLDESYRTARKTIQTGNLMHVSRMLRASGNVPFKPVSFVDKQMLLRHALKSGSADYSLNVVRDWLAEIRVTGYCSFETIKMSIVDLRAFTEQILMDHHIPNELLAEESDYFKQAFWSTNMNFNRFSETTIQYFKGWISRMMPLVKPVERLNVEAIKDDIDNHYFEEISISRYTDKYYVSKEHLLRLFKQKYGCGLYEYALRVRLNKTIELLEQTDLKIQDICQKVGYRDTNYFSKAFKKHTGLSPLEYRTSSSKQ